jgi:hypothetical protein
MSFYDDASLVVIPSGYKTSKVYAEKPTDGSGDLAFTRTGDTATRVNSAGLVEKVRTNLITYSEQLNNAAWIKEQVTITANATTSPDGTITADKVIANATAGDKYVAQIFTVAIGDAFTTSAYFKSSEYTYAFIRFGGLVSNPYVIYNLATQSVVTTSGLTSSSITSVGNGWYRITATVTSTTTTIAPVLMVIPSTGYTLGADNIPEFTGNGTSGGFIWGGQLELSDFGATDYIPTTTAAVSVGPVANVPRLDYLGSSCPRLLLEPQRQNLVTFSEQIDNAAWTKNVATITANASVSPDGYTNADTLTESTFTSDSSYILETLVVTPSVAYTTSIFVKQGAGRYVYLRNYYGAGNAYHTVVVDTQTGTITQASVGPSITNASSSIEAYGNGWYRVRATQTSAIEPALLTIIGLSDTATPTVGIFGQITIASNAGRSASVWGCQVEAAAYATSYIPTLAASATRGADAASKTGISSLIGQTEGTIFVEEVYDASVANNGGLDDVLVALTDGTTNNLFLILHYGVAPAGYSNVARFFIRTAGATQAQFDSVALASGTYKIALAYKNNDVVAYINGVQVGTDTSATIPATSVVTFVDPITTNAATKTVNIKQALLFKTRLTNAQLAELTTL